MYNSQRSSAVTLDAEYTYAYAGVVSGTTTYDSTHEVVIFSETDISYLQGRSDITASAWSVAGVGAGIKIAKVVVKRTAAPTGTVSNVGTVVTGVGTNFTQCAQVGGSLILSNDQRWVKTITSDLVLTLDAAPGANYSGISYNTVGVIKARTVSNGTLPELPRSYVLPLNDPAEVQTTLNTRCFLYDAGLELMVMASTGNTALGDRLVTGITTTMNTTDSLGGYSGALAFHTHAYNITLGAGFSTIRSGAEAWVGYALAAYYKKTGNATALSTAISMATFLNSLRIAASTANDYRAGLVMGGPDVSWVSVEHNLDCYFFFKRLYEVTGTATWRTAQTEIATGLLANCYDMTLTRFLQGTTATDKDYAEPLDVYSWAGCLLLDQKENAKAVAVANRMFTRFYVSGKTIALENTLPQFYNQTYEDATSMAGMRTYTTTTDGETGDTYVAPPESIWQEGTQGVLLFLKRLRSRGLDNQVTNFSQYETNLLNTQSQIYKNNVHGGLLAWTASDRLLPYEFQVWEALAPTCWRWLVQTDPNIIFPSKFGWGSITMKQLEDWVRTRTDTVTEGALTEKMFLDWTNWTVAELVPKTYRNNNYITSTELGTWTSFNLSSLAIRKIEKLVDATNGQIMQVRPQEFERIQSLPEMYAHAAFWTQHGETLNIFYGSSLMPGVCTLYHHKVPTFATSRESNLDIDDTYAALVIDKVTEHVLEWKRSWQQGKVRLTSFAQGVTHFFSSTETRFDREDVYFGMGS